jgi:hypothetical protein
MTCYPACSVSPWSVSSPGRRKSTFIYGIEDDAREVTDDLAGYLAGAR